jgi:hypothetical protein
MSNNYVQVPPNSTGVKLQTFENTVGGNTVDAEAVALVDTAGASILGTAGSPNADVLSVQGVSGGTAVPVSGTVATTPPANASTNLTEVGGSSVALGQAASAASIPVVLPAAQITTLTPLSTVAVTESGAWNVNQTLGTPGFEAITDGTNGPAAVKAASTAAVATDKALVVAISPNNTIAVSATSLPLPTGAATSALQPTNAAQGSTTSGQTGTLAEAAVTTANPVYTTGQTAPLSLVTNGGLRVSAATSFPVTSSAAPAASADNLLNENFFVSLAGNNNPLAVGIWKYGGAFSGTANAALQGWNKMRASTVFKTVQITSSAGTSNTAVWTPGSGNKFRLLKVFCQISDNASVASGTVVSVQLVDGSTNMPIVFDAFIPTTAVTTVIGDGLDQELDLGVFGILYATANNVLNVALTTALATGSVRIIAMGTEE